MTLYTRGFSHFVTSMTAPIASGWSEIAGWDSHPLRNAALSRRTHSADLLAELTTCLLSMQSDGSQLACLSPPLFGAKFLHSAVGR